MALSTDQYGYLIDPLVPITDDKGTTIKDGFLRVYIAGSSTTVITYRNFDGAVNEKTIELDNSGRCKYPIIVSKSLAYKVVVYDAWHSQETPIITIDKMFAIGASVTAGAGSTVVTGLDGLTTKPDGFVDASVIGTDGYVALDHTLVEDELDTDAKVTAVEDDRYVPLLNDDVNDPDSKMTLKRLKQWVHSDIFEEVNDLTEASDFNADDELLVVSPNSKRKMLWTTLRDKVLGFLKDLFGVKNEPEYLYAITDSSGALLFSIGKDGTVDWANGIPSQIRLPLEQLLQTVPNKVDKVTGKSLVNSTFADEISVISNEEYLIAIVDSSDRILFSINKRGEIDFQNGLPDSLSKYVKRLDEKENSVPGKSLVNSTFANGVSTKPDLKEYAYVMTDHEDRVLFSIDKSGMIEGKFKPGETQFFNTVADMMACTNPNLRFAVTMGFYSIGDGGACKYVVGAGTPNGFSSFKLASGRVARLVIEENYLYPEQVGYTNTDTDKDLRTYLFYITRDLLIDTVRFYNRRYYQNGPWIVPRQGISLIGSCNSGNQQSDGIYYFTRIFYRSTRTDDGACVFNCEYREFRLENLEIRNLDASDPSKPPRIGIYTLKFNDDPSDPDYHKNNHYDMILRNVVIGEFEYGLNLTGNIKWNLQIDNVRCNSCTYGCRIFGHVLAATFKLFYPDHCKVGILIDTLSVAMSFLYCNFGTVERCIVLENGIESSPYGQYTFVGCNFELDGAPNGPRPALFLDIEESYRAMITMIGCNFNFGLIGQSQYTNQCFCFKLSDLTEMTLIGCQQPDPRWNDQLFNPSYPAKKKLGSVKIQNSENVVLPNYAVEYLPTMDIDGSIITDSFQVLEQHYSDAAPGSIVYDRTADKAYIKLLNTYKEV